MTQEWKTTQPAHPQGCVTLIPVGDRTLLYINVMTVEHWVSGTGVGRFSRCPPEHANVPPAGN